MFRDSSSKMFPVRNIDADVFEELIKFSYTDEVLLTPETVTAIHSAAMQYFG